MMARGSTDKITTECPWQTVFSKFKHKQSYLEVTYFITSLAYSVAPHRQKFNFDFVVAVSLSFYQ